MDYRKQGNIMSRNKRIRITLLFIFAAVFLILISGCIRSKNTEVLNTQVLNTQTELSFENISFRDIPGVTENEIKSIEVLKKQDRTFIFGMLLSTESFINSDGVISGYIAHLCEWLSRVFDIPFKLELYPWNILIDGLNSKEIDFIGNLTVTEERHQTYFMTDPISKRSMKSIRIKDSAPFYDISKTRLLRYAFLEGSATTKDIFMFAQEPFEAVYVRDYINAYALLQNGEIDALIAENSAEMVFINYEDIIITDFLPFIYSPVSIATNNPELAPVISIVQKALENDASRFINSLYYQGYWEYMRHKLFIQLTEEEREYIANNHVIKMGAQHYNYPIDFFNSYENEWQGVIFDILEEMSMLTGLTFEVAVGLDIEWSDLLQLLEAGEVAFIPQLGRIPEREDRFLWSGHSMLEDRYLLISKTYIPNLNVVDIPGVKVALVHDYSSNAMFRRWFPNHNNIIEYNNFENACAALERGEADVMMGSMIQLLSLTNYQERTGYKINFMFDNTYSIIPGFNRNEQVLLSIMDKAFTLIDDHRIMEQWIRKTYDYQTRLAKSESRILSIIVVASILALALVIVTSLYIQNIKKRKIITEQYERATFLANMSHEMRTPMNVVMGLTELIMEEDDPTVNLKENLAKINTAGNTLLGLINNVLDISKIESGNLELSPIQYKLQHLVNDIITLNVVRVEEKPIKFKLDINENLPYCLTGDYLRVKQIINNLLSNAFKFTQKGTITLGMSCSPVQSGDGFVWMEIYISDTGIGIRKEDLSRLFTDYGQVDPRANRTIEGTGLGLSIAKRLSEMMYGGVSVESEYGKGSTFRLRVRQGYVSDETIGAETAEKLCNFRYAEDKRRKKLVRPDLSFARVLVVDDMQTNLDVAASLLGKYKLQVDCVLSGKEAVERIQSGALVPPEAPVYNAIFMDHMMPEMDGIETVNKIRDLGTDYAKKIPVFALTANAIQGTEKLFFKNDFQAFLTKPIDIIKMDAVIRKWIVPEKI
jgi:signal transduction histidine kinase/CheY-like chemotaxis protein